MLQFGQSSPLAPQISGLRGTDFAAWALAAFTISRARGCPHPAHHSGHRRGHHGVVRLARRGRLLAAQPLPGTADRRPGTADADMGHAAQPDLIGRPPTTEASMASINHYLDANEISYVGEADQYVDTGGHSAVRMPATKMPAPTVSPSAPSAPSGAVL